MKALMLMLVLAFTGSATAQEPPFDETTALDKLLTTPISTAAKYDQRMSDIPASVTVITSEEIARYGWHTLADLLNTVRGVYTSYDRGYSYLGVRGVGLPTDYNNRILVLIDGYPMQEAVLGSVGIGTVLAIDLSTFARIEFVRGPSSVLYGTGAMFGVINLIPKNTQDRPSLMLGGGSDGAAIAAARAGFRSGAMKGSITSSWQEKSGGTLYFREFDSPSTNDGIVRNGDFDDYHSVLATFGLRDLSMIALQSTRTKGVPTASWGSSFGAREQTTDERTLLGLRYSHRFAPGKQMTIAAHLDRFHYLGDYPGGVDSFTGDETRSTRETIEGQYVWDLRPNHRLTLGSRWTRNSRASYALEDASGETAFNAPATVGSIYGQSEWQPMPSLSITAGASYDHSSNDDKAHFMPRAGIVIHRDERTTWKLLYGESFREATVYEEFLGQLAEVNLRPESVSTSELVWEYRWTPDILISASLFDLRVGDVIRQSLDENGFPSYHNEATIKSRGIEMQVDYRRADGIWGYVSYSTQRARENGEHMVNSPSQLVKAGVSTPTSRSRQGAIELLYGSARQTLRGASTKNDLTANLNLTQALTRNLSIALTIRNLFDTDYALPGGPEHVQDTLQQDGRTFMIRFIAHAK